jgi:D-glycero-D-manno-heptose 1,7-bisphosphate phosphatase
MFPAIFLDRDGVIIENRPNYVRSWEDVKFFPQALTALASIANSSFKIIIVTNQSGVGRGLISLKTANEVNQRFITEIEQHGGRIDRVFMCPHSPDEGCNCRKPQPGLILRAEKELSIDLKRSIMIGDALSDIQAGQTAGIARTMLVRTGRGAEQANLRISLDLEPFQIFDTLSEALHSIK